MCSSHLGVTFNGKISCVDILAKREISERPLKSVDVGNLYKCRVMLRPRKSPSRLVELVAIDVVVQSIFGMLCDDCSEVFVSLCVLFLIVTI